MFTCLLVRLITRYQRWESRELSRGHKTIVLGLAARFVSKHSGTLLEHGYIHLFVHHPWLFSCCRDRGDELL